jgi:hypothetical protein
VSVVSRLVQFPCLGPPGRWCKHLLMRTFCFAPLMDSCFPKSGNHHRCRKEKLRQLKKEILGLLLLVSRRCVTVVAAPRLYVYEHISVTKQHALVTCSTVPPALDGKTRRQPGDCKNRKRRLRAVGESEVVRVGRWSGALANCGNESPEIDDCSHVAYESIAVKMTGLKGDPHRHRSQHSSTYIGMFRALAQGEPNKSHA